MANRTKISYGTHTANPYPGCVPMSAGCRNCWARGQAERWKTPGMGYINGKFQPGHYNENWAAGLGGKPKVALINFSGDLFGEWMNRESIHSVIDVLQKYPKNINLLLTKRAENMADFLMDILHYRNSSEFYHSLWFGVSICNQADWDKNKYHIRAIKSMVFNVWLSFEPLISEIDFGNDPLPVDWVVVGGESGVAAREMPLRTVYALRGTEAEARIPFYFKQLGDNNRMSVPLDIERVKECPHRIGEIRSLWP